MKRPNIIIITVLLVTSVVAVSVILKASLGNGSTDPPQATPQSLQTGSTSNLSDAFVRQDSSEAEEFSASAEESAEAEAARRSRGTGGDAEQRSRRGQGRGDRTGMGRGDMGGQIQAMLSDPNAMRRIQQQMGGMGGDLNIENMRGMFGGGDRGGRGGDRGGRGGQTFRVETTTIEEDPNDPLVSINLPNVQMQTIVERLSSWTGKAIVPSPDALDVRITIYSSKQVPRSQALNLIYAALRSAGIIAEETEKAINLKPIADARKIPVLTVAADEPLALLADKDQLVQKFFRLTYYAPSQLQQIILEMVSEFGYIGADDGNNNLIIIDTVSNLQRIERTLKILDVPAGSAQTVTRSFSIRYGDPAEIVQLIQMLLSGNLPMGTTGTTQGGRTQQQGRGGRGGRGGTTSATSVVISPFASTSSNRNTGRNTGRNQSSSTSTLVGASNIPIVLIPLPTDNQIIARGHPDDLEQIGEWIRQFDQKGLDEIDPDYFTIKVTYVNVLELATQISETVAQLPGSAITSSISVLPMVQSNTLMVFGSQESRELVKKLVLEIDIPADKFIVKHFKLKHADPTEISYFLQDLYMGTGTSSTGNLLSSLSSMGRAMGGSTRGGTSSMGASAGVAGGTETDMVRAIPYPSLKQVTVIASRENMEKIEAQIAEWDTPMDVDAVKPLIIEVRNSDPVLMADFLNRLFSTQGSSANAVFGMMFGAAAGRGTTATAQQQQQTAVVGPLYGKLTFEAVPDAKKIVVITQIPEAFEVIKKFVEELDREELAEVPEVVTLNYADPEDLCERLNALLNRDGTQAPYRLTTSTLSSYGSGAAAEAGAAEAPADETYQPWWNAGGGTTTTEQPISNIIGKIRFIPDRRSKAILFLAPTEYKQMVFDMIKELDQPARQVVIKAVIMEVSREKMTSLGVQFSSDPTVFAGMGESALYDLSTLFYGDTFNMVEFTTQLDVSTLVDFLVKNTDAKVLNQPSVWAKDNEEATFFSGGTIPFISGTTSGGTQIVPTNTYTQLDVGVTLRVKPNITPEEAVDMTVNLIISQEGPEILKNSSTTETNTTSHMIVQNGDTILLSGYIYQRDSEIVRKLPLLGDIPLLGSLFRHTEVEKIDRELLIFITPHVVEMEEETGDIILSEENQLAVQKMLEVKNQLDQWMLDEKNK